MLDLFSWHGLGVFGMIGIVVGVHIGSIITTYKINRSLKEQDYDIRFKY